MNELLAEYAGKALTWLESGAAWVAGEVPLYIEEVLRWNMARNIVMMCVYVILVSVFAIIAIKMIKAEDGDGIFYAISLFPIGAGIVCSIGIMHHLLTAIQISVAPRVFLIEYLSNMIN